MSDCIYEFYLQTISEQRGCGEIAEWDQNNRRGDDYAVEDVESRFEKPSSIWAAQDSNVKIENEPCQAYYLGYIKVQPWH